MNQFNWWKLVTWLAAGNQSVLFQCTSTMLFQNLFMTLSPGAHQVVQDGVDGCGQVVEKAWDVVEVLVQRPEDLCLLEVDVAESLRVKWGPAEEECKDHCGLKSWKNNLKFKHSIRWSTKIFLSTEMQVIINAIYEILNALSRQVDLYKFKKHAF